VDEWRRAYIKYRGLKKLIKRVAEHRAAREACAQGGATSGAVQSVQNSATRLLARSRSHFFSSGSRQEGGYGATAQGEGEPLVPPVTLKGTGLGLLDESTDAEAEPPYHLFFGKPTNEPGHLKDTEALTDENMSGLSFGQDRPAALRSVTWVIPQADRTYDLLTPEYPNMGVAEIIQQLFDDEEQKFFLALDHEVERILAFYLEREHEATERLSTLVEQLLELAEHRREFKAKTKRIPSGQLGLQRLLSKVPRGLDGEELNRLKLSVRNRQPRKPSENSSSDDDDGDKRRAEVMEHIQNLHISELRSASPMPSTQMHDPVEYKAARKKLRMAVIENYRALEILNNYRILNRNGFTKILKKFDKAMQSQIMHKYYDERVSHTPLVQSPAVPKMLEALEEIFTGYFEHGDRKRARDVLREGAPQTLIGHATSQYSSAYRTGVFMGIALCLTIEGLRFAMQDRVQAMMPQWRQLLVIYGMEFLPTLFALLFGLNLIAWQRVRINSVFIFELDAGNALEPWQYFELPALLLLLLSICFYLTFSMAYTNPVISPTVWPIVWLVVLVLILGNPLPVMHKSSRVWFLRTLARVTNGGTLTNVEFRDFFVGDELNSLAYSFMNLWVLGCEYQNNWAVPSHCSTSASWWVPVLGALPAFLRFTQCFRRYFDSDRMVRIHLVNAAKYASTILNVFFYFHYRHHGSQGTTSFVLWILFASINSVFTSSWDLIMDWNLLQSNAHYPLLRSHLAFDDIWPMYYVAMVTNVLIRFIWINYLFGGPASLPLRSFLAALLEMLRRWQWNFIRLENEHLGNADSFKIIRDLPLPYPVKRKSRNDDDDEEEDTKSFILGSMRGLDKKNQRVQSTIDTLESTKQSLDNARRRQRLETAV